MPTAQQLRNEQAATTLEERQAALASQRLRTQLAAAAAVILAAEKDSSPARLREIIGRVLRAVDPGVSAVLTGSVQMGVTLGRRQVLGPGHAPTVADVLRVVSDPSLAQVVAGADDRARARLETAAKVAEQLPMTTHLDVLAVLARARQATTGAETDAGWAVHRSIALAKHQAAREAGFNLVWVAERDACLHCLAYSGRVIAPFGTFPEGLTYGDHPIKPYGPLVGPPLHPNCRCQLDHTTLAPGTLDVGLAREAARSVARGLTDFASRPAMFRAVDRLVNGQTGLPDAALIRLPKSVMERARRNLAAGQFKARPNPQAARDRARAGRTAGGTRTP
jgi:hypothetical protein